MQRLLQSVNISLFVYLVISKQQTLNSKVNETCITVGSKVLLCNLPIVFICCLKKEEDITIFSPLESL